MDHKFVEPNKIAKKRTMPSPAKQQTPQSQQQHGKPSTTKPPTPQLQALTPSNNIIQKDSARQRAIETHIRNMCGMSPTCKFHNPSPNPVSIRREQLATVFNEQYVVAEKTDGVRYMLVMCKINEHENVSIMMDRACRMYEVNIAAPQHYFKGTILDGELAWENGTQGSLTKRLVYWAFDAFWMAGEDCRQENYFIRHSRVRHLLDLAEDNDQQHQEQDKEETAVLPKKPLSTEEILRMFAAEERNAQQIARAQNKIVAAQNRCFLKLQTKSIFAVGYLHMAWWDWHKASSGKNNKSSGLNHLSDGLIFSPIDQPVQNGTNRNMFKWKQHHTVDLVMNVTVDVDGTVQTKFQYGEDRFLPKGIITPDLPLVDMCAPEGFDMGNKQQQRVLIRSHPEDAMLDLLIQNLKKRAAQEKKKVIFEHVVECELYLQPVHLNLMVGPVQLQTLSERVQQRSESQGAEYIQLQQPTQQQPATTTMPQQQPTTTAMTCKLIRIRQDKKHPNNHYTVQQTIYNVMENINIDELLALSLQRFENAKNINVQQLEIASQ